ncbi:MAG: DUF6090 family protein [Bacteroidota bacterium]
MIKFFRRIRQKLVSENKFSKYLIYAFGEIVLVVIGILIALQINNWSQAKSDKEKFMTLLEELAVDLVAEVDETEFTLEAYYKKDSLIALNLTGQLEEKDMQAICPQCPRFLLLNYTLVSINTIAYDHIKSMVDRIPKEYDDLVTEIKRLYEVDVQRVLDQQKSIQDRTKDFRKSLISNYPWYKQVAYSSLEAEGIDYFLNDPIYQNHLSDFKNGGKNYWSLLNQFRGRAIYILHLIAQIKETEMEALLDSKTYLKASNHTESYAGRYRIPAYNNIEFKIESNKSRLYTSLFPEGSIALVPQSDSTFYFASRFIKFEFNPNTQDHLSLIGSDGTSITCEKIE